MSKATSLGLFVPEDLENLAIARGLRYYDGRNAMEDLRREPRLQVSREAFSDAELAIALLGPAQAGATGVVRLYRQRLGAATLSAAGVDPSALAALATEESCTGLVRYIAECGRDVEPGNPFWPRLLDALPWEAPPEDRPHITRMIEMTGINRGKVGIQRRWLRPVSEGNE